MKWMAALALSLLAVACDGKADDATPQSEPSERTRASASPPAPEPKATYPDGAWGPVRDTTVRGPTKNGIVAVTRVLISKITLNDPIGVAIRFEGEGGPFAATDPAGKRQLDWSASLEKIAFVLTVNGTEDVLEVANKPSATDVSPIGRRARVLHLGPAGLEQFAGVTKWKTPPSALRSAGAVTLRMRGELFVDGQWVAFESGEMKIEIEEAGANLLPLDNLEGIATRLVEKTERLKKSPAALGHPVDDTSHHRVFRFRLDQQSPGYDQHFVDVAVSPKGGVIAARRFKHFTCVAADTAIATPRGDVAVQSLAIGDEVWAYDTARKERVATPVIALFEGEAHRLVSLGDLRVTGEHPIYADGAWVAARDVRAGARLLTTQLEPRTLPSIATIDTKARVYDVSVASPHNFFAGGVLVHNKAVAVPLGPPGDPWQGLFTRGSAK